jgi:hypothetical protein
MSFGKEGNLNPKPYFEMASNDAHIFGYHFADQILLTQV